jgi:hypothetical protein
MESEINTIDHKGMLANILSHKSRFLLGSVVCTTKLCDIVVYVINYIIKSIV